MKNLNFIHLLAPQFTYRSHYAQFAFSSTASVSAEITLPKNGYLFVLVSNEMERKRNSPNPLKSNEKVFGQSQGTVYFDDLSIQHTPGNLLEEHHYYPTGL